LKQKELKDQREPFGNPADSSFKGPFAKYNKNDKELELDL